MAKSRLANSEFILSGLDREGNARSRFSTSAPKSPSVSSSVLRTVTDQIKPVCDLPNGNGAYLGFSEKTLGRRARVLGKKGCYTVLALAEAHPELGNTGNRIELGKANNTSAAAFCCFSLGGDPLPLRTARNGSRSHRFLQVCGLSSYIGKSVPRRFSWRPKVALWVPDASVC
jgi:hypothetical protein